MLQRIIIIFCAATSWAASQSAFSPDTLGISFGAGTWSPAHLNTDARADMVAALTSPGGSVTVITAVSSGPTGWNGVYSGLPGMPSLGTLRAGDLNGDGQDDLVVTSASPASGVWTWLGNGTGAFPSGVATANSGFNLIRLGHFTADTNLDALGLVAAGCQILTGNGSGGLSAGPVLALPSVPAAGTVGDVDQDGDLDLVFDLGANGIRSFLNPGNGAFVPGPISTGILPSVGGLVLADVDGALGPDLAWLAGAPGLPTAIAIAFNNGGGSFTPAAFTLLPSVAPGLWHLRTADLDQDGAGDVIALRTAAGTAFGLWHADGRASGLFPPTDVLVSAAANHSEIETVDWDGDGDTDLVLRTPGAPFEIALNLRVGLHAGRNGSYLGGCLPGPVPTLRLSGSTAPGALATLTTASGPANASASLLIGLLPARLEPLPNCWLAIADWPTALILPHTLDAAGSSAITFLLPALPPLTGIRFVLQDLLFSPLLPAGVTATNGLLVIPL